MRLDIVPSVFQLPDQPVPLATPVAPDGTFQVVGLREGEYRVEFNVSGYYTKSIQYGGDDILRNPFTFSGSSGTFEVVVRQGAAQINGTVTDAGSQPATGLPVYLVPALRNRADLFRRSVSDQNGHFTFANLPPGEYKVFSWEAIENGSPFDPDFMKQYEQQGKIVQVRESSSQNVDVRVIPAL